MSNVAEYPPIVGKSYYLTLDSGNHKVLICDKISHFEGDKFILKEIGGDGESQSVIRAEGGFIKMTSKELQSAMKYKEEVTVGDTIMFFFAPDSIIASLGCEMYATPILSRKNMLHAIDIRIEKIGIGYEIGPRSKNPPEEVKRNCVATQHIIKFLSSSEQPLSAEEICNELCSKEGLNRTTVRRRISDLLADHDIEVAYKKSNHRGALVSWYKMK